MHFRPAVFCGALLFFVTAASAQQDRMVPVAMAVLENDPVKLDAVIRNALISDSAHVRALAARLANARKELSMVNAVRAALDRESDANAARELARAAIMLGGVAEVDRALHISERFGSRFDGAIAIAAARSGAPALDFYISRFRGRQVNDSAFVHTLLWGRPQLSAGLMSRLIAADYRDGIIALLDATVGDELPKPVLDAPSLVAAINHKDKEVRAEALWHVAIRSIEPGGSPMEPSLKAAIANVAEPGEGMADLAAAVELARRAAGFPHRNGQMFRSALAGSYLVAFRFALAPKKLRDYLSDDEKLLIGTTVPKMRKPKEEHTVPPPFILPSLLPDGAAAAVMTGSGCKDGWVGVARVSIDEQGRVKSDDVSSVVADANCRRAVDALLKLSIVSNTRLNSPFESNVSLVQSDLTTPCLDEATASRTDVVYIGGGASIILPRLRTRVEPDYPPGKVDRVTEVVVEAVVSASGCVRAARIIKPAPVAAMNRAAMKAVSQWTFDPAKFDGEPVEFLHKVTVEFRP